VVHIVVLMGAIVKIRFILKVFMCCVVFFSTNVFAKRGFEAPPKATVQWVSQSGKVEGMDLSIRRFEIHNMSVDDVLAYYEKKWKGKAAQSDLKPWKMIGTVRGKEYWNVQVQSRASGGSWGYLSVSDLPDVLKNKKPFGVEARQGKKFPSLTGSSVINDFSQDDVGKKGRTLLIQNESSVATNANYYRNYYVGRGYGVSMDQSDLRSASYVLVFNKLNESVSLAITRSGDKTSVVANEVIRGF